MLLRLARGVHTLAPIQLKFFTKPNCMLCYEAKTVLNKALVSIPKDQYTLEFVDIEQPDNKKWSEMYRYDIPVLHIEREGYNRVQYMHRFDSEEITDELKEEM